MFLRILAGMPVASETSSNPILLPMRFSCKYDPIVSAEINLASLFFGPASLLSY
jgi:hypothetical protein